MRPLPRLILLVAAFVISSRAEVPTPASAPVIVDATTGNPVTSTPTPQIETKATPVLGSASAVSPTSSPVIETLPGATSSADMVPPKLEDKVKPGGPHPSGIIGRGIPIKDQATSNATTTEVLSAQEQASKPTSASRRSSPTPSTPVTPTGPFRITKIHHVQNDETYRWGRNDALAFEKKYWDYGAVTKAEQATRRGHYYVISWVNGAAPRDVVATFEYRQLKSKDVVRSFELKYPAAGGANRSVFAVTGDAYQNYGPVTSWRFTLTSGGQIVAQETSFIW
jgi:hypothetical protein